MAYILTLPTEPQAITNNVLLRRYPIDVGLALLITGSSGYLTAFPSQTEIAEADYYFGGGRRNVLSDAQYAAVVAAGYSEYVSVE